MTLPISPQPGSPGGGSSPFNTDHTPFQAIGGEERVRALVDAFYDHMDADDEFKVIRDLHQSDLTEARQKLYEFLCGWLGGPQLYIEKHGHPRLRMRHAPFPITRRESDQWLGCMACAMDDLSIDGDLRAFLVQRFTHVAQFMENR